MKKEKQGPLQKKETPFLSIVLSIALLGVIAYFIYTLIASRNEADQLQSILSVGLITIFAILFTFTAMTANRKGKLYALFASIILLLYSGLQLLNQLGIFSLPQKAVVEDFTNQIFTEAVEWATEHHITLNETYEYSDLIEEYHVIYQSVAPNTLVRDIASLDIIISNGADPEKEVTVPNMIGWTADEVLKFIEENFLSNVEVEFVISDKTKDTVIEQEGSGVMKRNASIKLTFSIGQEEDIKEFQMADLIDKTKFEATFYLKQHGVVNYETPEDYGKIKRGNVLKQNIAEGKTVKPKEDQVIITISKGEKIEVPDLTKMTVKEITAWVTEHRLKINFKEQYDDSVKEGMVIKANHQKGDIIEEGETIEVTISKGPLTMPSNLSLNEFKAWAEKYGIQYIENYEFNDEVAQGEVIHWSHSAGQTIKNGETVTILISQGTAVIIPDFDGMTKSAITKKCNSLEITCTFQYRYSNSVAEGLAIDQSKEAGSKVEKGTSIDITLSNGKRPSSSSGDSGSTSSSDSGGNSNNESSTTSCDRSQTITVYLDAAQTGELTKQLIQNRYPTIKWNFNMVDACSNGSIASGTICNAPSIDGTALNYCDTYTLTIVK